MNLYDDILTLQKKMEDGSLSSYEITSFYLNRIQTIDQGEINYNSVYMINPDALDIAKSLDKERKQGKIRSKMHGIPVLLKDNINTKDKTTTTAGANILKDHIAAYDASIVETLRAQGAVILGKTNLTELACFKTFTGINGFSSLGGQVLCPWDINEDPSGSSTGSAVATALRLAPVAIGTETGGSIMSPSMKNGIYGLKPTMGLVPRTGILPISSTLDTAGPMANHISDIAVLLSSMKSNDPKDLVTLNKDDIYTDYTKYLHTNNVKRIGLVNMSAYTIPHGHKEIFESTSKSLTSLGYELINIDVEEVKQIYQIMLYEFKHEINRYFKHEGLDITLKSMIAYNELHPDENLKYGQQVLLDAEKTSGNKNEDAYINALNEREAFTHKMEKLFKDNNIDLLYFVHYTSIGPECGFPTLSMPLGYNDQDMPIGSYFLAPKYMESSLIEVGHKLEKHLNKTFDPLKK